MGLERTESNYGLYMLKDENEVKLLLTVCVANLLLIGPRDICAKVAVSLQETFELANMGNVKHLLGVEILINRPRREIVYCQRQYVLEVLKRFHMENFATGVQPPKRLVNLLHWCLLRVTTCRTESWLEPSSTSWARQGLTSSMPRNI
ncbi:hypothetical protein PF003_g2336 [Phytophthora fragariae]|nr:hypothetical protein PF003_g2336 [Phytophthora fragariae]